LTFVSQLLILSRKLEVYTFDKNLKREIAKARSG